MNKQVEQIKELKETIERMVKNADPDIFERLGRTKFELNDVQDCRVSLILIGHCTFQLSVYFSMDDKSEYITMQKSDLFVMFDKKDWEEQIYNVCREASKFVNKCKIMSILMED